MDIEYINIKVLNAIALISMQIGFLIITHAQINAMTDIRTDDASRGNNSF